MLQYLCMALGTFLEDKISIRYLLKVLKVDKMYETLGKWSVTLWKIEESFLIRTLESSHSFLRKIRNIICSATERCIAASVLCFSFYTFQIIE